MAQSDQSMKTPAHSEPAYIYQAPHQTNGSFWAYFSVKIRGKFRHSKQLFQRYIVLWKTGKIVSSDLQLSPEFWWFCTDPASFCIFFVAICNIWDLKRHFKSKKKGRIALMAKVQSCMCAEDCALLKDLVFSMQQEWLRCFTMPYALLLKQLSELHLVESAFCASAHSRAFSSYEVVASDISCWW